jgi:hypothetical protein
VDSIVERLYLDWVYIDRFQLLESLHSQSRLTIFQVQLEHLEEQFQDPLLRRVQLEEFQLQSVLELVLELELQLVQPVSEPELELELELRLYPVSVLELVQLSQ